MRVYFIGTSQFYKNLFYSKHFFFFDSIQNILHILHQKLFSLRLHSISHSRHMIISHKMMKRLVSFDYTVAAETHRPMEMIHWDLYRYMSLISRFIITDVGHHVHSGCDSLESISYWYNFDHLIRKAARQLSPFSFGWVFVRSYLLRVWDYQVLTDICRRIFSSSFVVIVYLEQCSPANWFYKSKYYNFIFICTSKIEMNSTETKTFYAMRAEWKMPDHDLNLFTQHNFALQWMNEWLNGCMNGNDYAKSVRSRSLNDMTGKYATINATQRSSSIHTFDQF